MERLGEALRRPCRLDDDVGAQALRESVDLSPDVDEAADQRAPHAQGFDSLQALLAPRHGEHRGAPALSCRGDNSSQPPHSQHRDDIGGVAGNLLARDLLGEGARRLDDPGHVAAPAVMGVPQPARSTGRGLAPREAGVVDVRADPPAEPGLVSALAHLGHGADKLMARDQRKSCGEIPPVKREICPADARQSDSEPDLPGQERRARALFHSERLGGAQDSGAVGGHACGSRRDCGKLARTGQCAP